MKSKNKKLGVLVENAILSKLALERQSKTPKMTRADLAKELDVDPATAMRIENGEFELNIVRFVEICQILELNPVEVFTTAFEKVGPKTVRRSTPEAKKPQE